MGTDVSKADNMATDVTRYIKRDVERELWARAAGRCQFNGCNRLVYKSPVTQENVNISEKAHIYSFSEDGPRGWGSFVTNKKALNELNNLMLLCHDCHKTIDETADGGRYTAKLLIQWKREHEKRIVINTGVSLSKKSNVIIYGANIGDEKSDLQPDVAKEALFPDRYPSEEHPLELSMTWEGIDVKPDYWQTEAKNLRALFEREVRPLINRRDPSHFSVFGLAPMPLLTLLGSLFTDKVDVDVHEPMTDDDLDIYQLKREPCKSWRWVEKDKTIEFIINTPKDFTHPPALVISLSGIVTHDRVTEIVGNDISLWELTIDDPHNDFLKTRKQLSAFRETVRKLMVQIRAKHPRALNLMVFPAMPVACAIDFGRVRMPQVDYPFEMYNHNRQDNKFVRALTIGGNVQ